MKELEAEWSKRLGSIVEREIELIKDRNPNITNYQIAEKMGISPSLLSSILQGKRNPSSQNLYQIAQYLGCSMDYLAGLSPVKSPIPSKQELTVSTIQEMTGMPRELIVKLLNHRISIYDLELLNDLSSSYYFEQLMERVRAYMDYDKYESDSVYISSDNSSMKRQLNEDGTVTITRDNEDYLEGVNGAMVIGTDVFEKLLIDRIGGSLKEIKERSENELDFLKKHLKRISEQYEKDIDKRGGIKAIEEKYSKIATDGERYRSYYYVLLYETPKEIDRLKNLIKNNEDYIKWRKTNMMLDEERVLTKGSKEDKNNGKD